MLDRFVDKFYECPNTGCWIWTASTFSSGYGKFKLDGRSRGAHQVSYEANVAPTHDGLCVLHRCDVPLCVNPDHLFLGTQADNMADRSAKGRTASGEAHGHAKLTEDDVRAIRKDSRTQEAIAKDYGVTHPLISYIKNKKIWRHIG